MTPPTNEDKPAFVKAFEKDQEKTEKILQSFNIDDFVADADETKTVEVDGVGVVKYKRLTVEDSFKLQEAKNVTEQGIKIIYLMLGKADPNVTEDKIRKLPPVVAEKILSALSGQTDFLPQKK